MRQSIKKMMSIALVAAMCVTMVSIPQSSRVTSAAESAGAIDPKLATTKTVVVPDVPMYFEDLSSDEIIKEMGTGWNLGNTLDAWSGKNFITGETLWQSTKTTKSLIKKIHDMGFNTIRIPVTYGANINDDEDYSVDEEWMSRIQEVVDYAVTEDMYVELNIHHDGCANSAPTPHGWLDIDGTEEEFAAVKEKFVGLWKSIATRFKNYDEHLIFAAMNEVYDDDHEIGWGDFDRTDLEQYFEVEFPRINELNQGFVDVVRSTGGNNVKRWLAVQPHNTQIAALMQTSPKFSFAVPQDTNAESRIMVEIHDYDAYSQDVAFNLKEDSYASQFKWLKENYVDKGVPILVGEWGFDIGGSTRAFKFEGVVNLMRRYSLVGTVWDNGYTNPKGKDQYGIIDRAKEVPSDECATALIRGFYTDGDLDKDSFEKDEKGKYQTPTVVPATDITVSKESVTMKVHDKEILTSAITAPADSNDTVVWSSSDSTIASVSNGCIHANAVGTVIITAKALSGEVAKTVEVKVEPKEVAVPATDLSLNTYSIALEQNHEYYLRATVEPNSYEEGVTYHVANPQVATVSPDGRVLAKELGKTVVTAVTADGLSKKVDVQVVGEEKRPITEKQVRLAIRALYNRNKNEGQEDEAFYGGTETSSDVLTLGKNGTYTLTFDCAKDLSAEAQNFGIADLNNLGALYIYDYDVAMGNAKKSPEIESTISYTSIKVDDKELLDAPTKEYKTMKGGIYDTGNPLNVWDGSVVPESALDIHKSSGGSSICFAGIDNPTKIAITFKIAGFSESIGLNEETPTPTNKPVVSSSNACKKINAAKKTLTIKKKKSKTITFNVTNTDAGKKTTDKIKVLSSKKKIVKVVKTTNSAKKISVKVKALKKGKSVITVKVGAKSAKTTVKVK